MKLCRSGTVSHRYIIRAPDGSVRLDPEKDGAIPEYAVPGPDCRKLSWRYTYVRTYIHTYKYVPDIQAGAVGSEDDGRERCRRGQQTGRGAFVRLVCEHQARAARSAERRAEGVVTGSRGLLPVLQHLG